MFLTVTVPIVAIHCQPVQSQMCCESVREVRPNVNRLPHSVSMAVKVRGILLFSAAIMWKGELERDALCSVLHSLYSCR